MASPDDLLYVQDFQTVKQRVTAASVELDDRAVADFFESQVDAGRQPEQFARIWLHTHPGFSARPSSVDEETFARVFGGCEWAVMFILGTSGRTYARLRFNVGPGGDAEIPVEVDYRLPFAGSNGKAWDTEFEANIDVDSSKDMWDDHDVFGYRTDPDDLLMSEDFAKDLKAMDPAERRQVLAEMLRQPDLLEEGDPYDGR